MMNCSKCGTKPRHVSRSGQELSMCLDCNRAYWRKSKTPNPRAKVKTPKPMPVRKRKCAETAKQLTRTAVVRFLDGNGLGFLLSEGFSPEEIRLVWELMEKAVKS